ncbi:glutathione synthase [Chryseobacterium cheonjiense]|uniref:Glutathione synthase n=1 Tax=Chryseobacterium cheonjiense TaxID=2728845 RepID=A0A7Y0A5G7_9FLAO|nr:glutathione synthase [Chryseobacterium cheonjiense]NML57002.1 glutathione synthase [Chryseobacterium cheonjiense]
MAHRNFRKEDFFKDEGSDLYQVEFRKGDVGEGADLVVERQKEDGEYETLQAQMKRHNDRIFICWSEPFYGRVIFDE